MLQCGNKVNKNNNYTDNISDLGFNLLLTFNRTDKCYVLKTDKKSWLYKSKKEFWDSKVFSYRYYLNEDEIINLHNTKKVLNIERKMVKELNLYKLNIRLSGMVLRMSGLPNSATIMITNLNNFNKIRSNFRSNIRKIKYINSNENILGLKSVPISFQSELKNKKFIKSLFLTDVNLKHHLKSALNKINNWGWEKDKSTNKYHFKGIREPQLLLIMESYNNLNYIDLPGGKRKPGEDSFACMKRELYEETFYRFTKKDIIYKTFEIDYMKFYIILKKD